MSNPVSNAVRNQVGIAASASFKRVVGGIFKSKGSASTSAFKKLEAPTESNYLSYPTNVDTDPMQGHWVMFEILQLNPEKVTPRAKFRGGHPGGMTQEASEKESALWQKVEAENRLKRAENQHPGGEGDRSLWNVQ